MSSKGIEPADKLRVLIKHSGLSVSAFARVVVMREPRTVRRWLSGESPIPVVVQAWMDANTQPSGEGRR